MLPSNLELSFFSCTSLSYISFHPPVLFPQNSPYFPSLPLSPETDYCKALECRAWDCSDEAAYHNERVKWVCTVSLVLPLTNFTAQILGVVYLIMYKQMFKMRLQAKTSFLGFNALMQRFLSLNLQFLHCLLGYYLPGCLLVELNVSLGSMGTLWKRHKYTRATWEKVEQHSEHCKWHGLTLALDICEKHNVCFST